MTKGFILKLYATSLTFILGYIILSGFTSNATSNKFKEITVERINVVEPDGTLVMVISNSKKQHPGMFDGKVLENRVRPPGVIFFNEEQELIMSIIERLSSSSPKYLAFTACAVISLRSVFNSR